ncbi:Fc receptor-like protein 6 [Ctenodactylus gundi]
MAVELFQPPVLSAIPSSELSEGSPLTLRCQTKRPSKKLTSKLLFSFHKESYALQRWDHHPEFCIPGVKEADSGLYWCNVILEKGQIQKQSPQLEIKVQAPVSSPSLTLRHRFAGPAAGHMVELLCEARRGSPPILYSFYLNGEILGNRSATHGGAVSLLFPVESAKDTGNYSCEAKNNVSREKSEPKTLSLMGPIPAQNIPPAPGGEQWPLHDNVHHQEEKDEDVTYSVVRTTSRKNKARPADFASGEKDISVIYAESLLIRTSLILILPPLFTH